MEQFNALPLQQKLIVLVVAMAVVGGLFWYALIMPLAEQTEQAEALQRQTQAELDKLAQEAAGPGKAEVEEKTAKLAAEKERFENMLPRAEELVKFITGISDTAKNAGLDLLSFEKGRADEQDYYLEIPIKMEVRGTFRELIAFLRTISEKDWRIVNIRDFQLTTESPDVSPILREFEQRRRDELPEGMAPRQLTDAQKLRDLVRANEELIRRGVFLKATFVAYVFTYTGKAASAEAAGRSKAKVEARRKRREGNLVIL